MCNIILVEKKNILELSVSIYKIISRSRNNNTGVELGVRNKKSRKKKGRKKGRKLRERNCRGNDRRESNDLG